MCDVSPDEESSMTCSRVRPVNKVRRRRIIDTYGLHHRLPKAAKVRKKNLFCSVADPLHFGIWIWVRGSVTLTNGSGHLSSKNNKKAMVLTVLYDFLSVKNYVNMPSESSKQKNFERK